MNKYTQIILDSFSGYYNYLVNEILNLTEIISIGSLGFLYSLGLRNHHSVEKNQQKIRKDFWLDAFYMFFNFFLFSLIGYNAVSNVSVEFFNDGLKSINRQFSHSQYCEFPYWGQL